MLGEPKAPRIGGHELIIETQGATEACDANHQVAAMLVFVARLEAFGATKRAEIAGWVIMEAPTGQRFNVAPAVRAGFNEYANTSQ